MSYFINGTSGSRIDVDGFFGSPRPPYIPDHPNSVRTLATISNYLKGANAWTVSGVTMDRQSTSSSPDVIVRGFWEDVRRCKGSIACIATRGYPHLSENAGMKMWFEEPPTWGTGPHKRWTDNLFLYQHQRDHYVYLPVIIMHEFGHAIGLKDHGRPGTVMDGYYYDGVLTAEDENAAKATYQPHVAH